MKLPSVKYTDGIAKSKQVKFGGLNHSAGAGDGELWNMQNMTSDHYPLLASRRKRRLYKQLQAAGGLFAWDKLCWVADGKFFYDGKEKGALSPGQKFFAAMGKQIVIFPDKCYYNTETDTFGSLESRWEGGRVTFADGVLYEREEKGNCIQVAGVDWSGYFRIGDAVQIEGCTKYAQNNKTTVVRAMDGDKLFFSGNAFAMPEGSQSYTETGKLVLQRTVPELLGIWEHNNRLWGYTEDTVYASKWDDIFNWNYHDVVDDAAWNITPGATGSFTGCCTYGGYPVFFKEDHIYKIYGSLPSNFEILGSATLGLGEGSAGSLAIAGETLFYLGRNGVMAYTGGLPQPIGDVFGLERFKNAVAGSDGLKYYICMQSADGSWGLYVYDTQRGVWHKEDETHVTHFARFDGNLYFLNDAGEVWVIDSGLELPEGTDEESVSWMAEFTDFTDGDPNKKGVGKVQLRLELDAGADAQVWIQFDSDGVWRKVGIQMGQNVKRSYYLPITPQRCDHYRVRITGQGGCRIHSLVREFYSGSELKSTKGRN